jgi:hypothetical protein
MNKPSTAERAAWFRENNTSVPEQLDPTRLQIAVGWIVYGLFFGVFAPLCKTWARLEDLVK